MNFFFQDCGLNFKSKLVPLGRNSQSPNPSEALIAEMVLSYGRYSDLYDNYDSYRLTIYHTCMLHLRR